MTRTRSLIDTTLHELPPPSITDGQREAMVLHHVADLEDLQHDGANRVHQMPRRFMAEIGVLITHSTVQPHHSAMGTGTAMVAPLTARRPLLGALHSVQRPSQMPGIVRCSTLDNVTECNKPRSTPMRVPLLATVTLSTTQAKHTYHPSPSRRIVTVLIVPCIGRCILTFSGPNLARVIVPHRSPLWSSVAPLPYWGQVKLSVRLRP